MNPAQPQHSTPPGASVDLASLDGARRDMRMAYLDGAPGMLASSLAWAIAGCVAAWMSPQRAVWALFAGGVFIHPVGVLFARALGRTGRHAPGNPLAALAMATTFWMILMLPLAYGVSLLRIDLFFPAMLFVIGGRYLCFDALYGSRLYWFCGAALALAGYGLAALHAPVALGGFAGAAIEALFACLLLAGARRAALIGASRPEGANVFPPGRQTASGGRIRLAAPSRPGSRDGRRGLRSPGRT